MKNAEVEQPASEVAGVAHETKSEAIRQYLEREVWPLNPPSQVGRALTREEEGQILGYGPGGF